MPDTRRLLVITQKEIAAYNDLMNYVDHKSNVDWESLDTLTNKVNGV